MKKNYSLILSAAALFVTLCACSKVEVSSEVTPATHSVTFIADAVSTKTAIGGDDSEGSAYFVWTEADAQYLRLYENGVASTTAFTTGLSITISDDGKTASFTSSFGDSEASSFVYSGYLSKEYSESKNPKMSTTQTCTAEAYDSSADILIAKSTDSYSEKPSSVSLQFYRPVVINKMTLKGLTEDETITSVTVSSDKPLRGIYNLTSESWTNETSEIVVNTSQTVTSDGTAVIWFVSEPTEGATLTVTATSSNYTFSKTFTSTIDFTVGKVTRFSVSGLTATAKMDYSGTYVLADKSATRVVAPYVTDATSLSSVAVAKEGDIIYYDPDALELDKAKLTLAKITDSSSDYYGLYTIKQDGLYLYCASTSSKNYLKASASLTDASYWEVSVADGEWTISASKVTSTTRNVIRHNSTSTNKIFSCYQSGSQAAVALYSTDVVKSTPVISGTGDISIGSSAVSDASLAASFNSDAATVSAAAFDDSAHETASTWLTVSVSGTGTSAALTYSATANDTGAERTAYIVITATNADGRSVSAGVAVTQAAEGGIVLLYTLEPTATSNDTYAKTADVEISGITWNVRGSSKYVPWRLGGKSLTNENLPIYSKTPIAGNVSQIVISQSKSSSSNSITINSMSVYVCSTADGAAADTPTDVVASFTPSVTLGTDVTIDKADDTSWAGCYYRIVYNVTVTKTSNQRFQFEGAKFYGTSE